MSTSIQEQSESTVGRKPPHRPGAPFARYRVRREEAEESDLGGEIRDRDEEGPAERGVIEGPAGAPPPEGKPSVP